jgi:N-acetylneuraminic acid mutarotase
VKVVAGSVLLVILAAAPVASAGSRAPAFSERVRAERKIAQLAYSHQELTVRTFDEAVPQAVLEERVRTTLKLSIALERVWHTPITLEALDRELNRIRAHTRSPERLRELEDALGNDPDLLRECLARPLLARRLAQHFFETDPAIHAGAHRRALELWQSLRSGEVKADTPHPLRAERRWRRRDDFAEDEMTPLGPGVSTEEADAMGRPVGTGEFTKRRARVPRVRGEIGEVTEERDAFVLRALLDEEPDRFREATYSIKKKTWDEWWTLTAPAFDESTFAPVHANGEGREDALARTASGRGAPEENRALASSCVQDHDWDPRALTEVPDARTEPSGVWTGTEFIVWGGSGHAGEVFRSGARYDPLTDTWTPISTLNAPSLYGGHHAVWTGSTMIVYGRGTTPAIGGRYDPATDTWLPMSVVGAPAPANGPTVTWSGGRMIVWGGVDNGIDPLGSGRYDPQTDHWESMSTTGQPSPVYLPVATDIGGRVFIWCGQEISRGGIYDVGADTWQAFSSAGVPSPREGNTVVWTGSRVIVWGGRSAVNGALLADGGVYDPATGIWDEMVFAGAPGARAQHAAIWTGQSMLIWGGYPYYQDSARYDPATGLWTPMTGTGAPSGRTNFAAAWTGALLLVWGGENQQNAFDTGGRYGPASDSWTPIAHGAPFPAGTTAVWTGSEVFTWGGFDGAALGWGSRYNPALDSWSPVSTVNAPSPRSDNTAVWTGQHVIVWSGYNAPSYPATGGRYDPVADTWSPTATSGAPVPRASAAAVWTGSQIVVWGGFCCNSYRSDGGRYDPATDVWSPVANGFLSPRAGHTAVWTGTEMIVWGGSSNSNYWGDGGRYNPATNQWTHIPTQTIPNQRTAHSAVWTGSRMIVWGGYLISFGSLYFNDGAAYDPVSSTWNPIALEGAPTPRAWHSAVWDGQEMIVWGGKYYAGQFHDVDTGGIYRPSGDLWQPLPRTSIPSPRWLHTALWIGDRMLVLGGYSGTSSSRTPLLTGHIFGPASPVDRDGDGLSTCAGDCDDSDAGVMAIPPEVNHVRWTDKDHLSWDSTAAVSGPGAVYDVLKGDVDRLPVSGDTMTFCTTPIVGTIWTPYDTPAPGHGDYYLVRAHDTCGYGPWGVVRPFVLGSFCP